MNSRLTDLSQASQIYSSRQIIRFALAQTIALFLTQSVRYSAEVMRGLWFQLLYKDNAKISAKGADDYVTEIVFMKLV